MNTYIKSLLFAALFCHFDATHAAMLPKPTDNSVKSFVIEAPDTVEQGVPFNITYRLTATHWDSYKLYASSNVVEVNNMNRDISTDGRFYILKVTGIAVANRTGEIELPPLVIPVDKHDVRPQRRSVFVKANHLYGEELSAVLKSMIDEGASADSIALKNVKSTDCYYLFEAQDKTGFAIVANRKYWQCLQNPILGVGYGNSFMSVNLNSRLFEKMVRPYTEQLKMLASKSEAITE